MTYTVTSNLTKKAKSFATVGELRHHLIKMLKRHMPLWTRECFTEAELETLWGGLNLLKPGDTVNWLRWTIAVN